MINPLTQQPIENHQLIGVANLANKQIALESEIATLEELLKRRKDELTQLQMMNLPTAMAEIGLSEFTLSNGAAIHIDPFYSCYLSDDHPDLKEQGLKWLRKNDLGSVIKHEVKVALGVDAVKELTSLRGFLNRKSIPFKDGQGVHNATLKALMRERIEGGKSFPLDIFRGFCGKKAKITIGK